MTFLKKIGQIIKFGKHNDSTPVQIVQFSGVVINTADPSDSVDRHAVEFNSLQSSSLYGHITLSNEIGQFKIFQLVTNDADSERRIESFDG